jgi:hypothetical protein
VDDAQSRQNHQFAWLLHCYHRHCLVDTPAPAGTETLFPESHPWLVDATGAEIQLDYEPRSLAINREADRVAVGTKSGKVHVATRRGSNWSTAVVSLKDIDSRTTSAVRGLAFGATGRLYACTRSGRAWLLDDERDPQPIKLPDDDAEEFRGWVGRCQRLLPLTPPNASAEAGHEDDFLLLTRGNRTCRLRDEALRVIDVSPHEGAATLFPGWSGERITAGAWTGDYLWVLGEGGALHLFGFASHEFEPVAQYSLHYPRGRGLFGDISPTPVGLGVLVADDVTFLPFESSRERTSGPRLRLDETGRRRGPEVSPRTWRHVQDAMDVATWLPFYGSQDELDNAKDVTLFVAQAHRGLSAMTWPIDDDKRQVELSSVPLDEHREAPSALFVAVRTTPGSDHRPAGIGPAVLAVSTRDHRLILRSLLDRTTLESTLKSHWDGQRPDEPQNASEAWWLASQELKERGHQALDVAGTCLPHLEAGDVRRLAVTLMAKPLQGTPETEAKGFKGWIRGLLRRAGELGTQALDDTCAEIAEGLSRQAPDGQDWLKHYEGLFRKWVIYGYTYGEKELGLRDLCQANVDGGRGLDALTYLTKCIRKRADPVWRVEVADPTLRSAAWDLHAAKDGGLVLASFTDGTIAALGLDGTRYAFAADRPADLGVEIDRAGRILSVGSREFRRKYHHGPYARRLYVEQLDGRRYLAVFALRGWRREDLKLKLPGARNAQLVALELELDKKNRQVFIRGGQSHRLDDEGYAIAERYRGPAGHPTYLLIGTAAEGAAETGQYSPFLEVELSTHGGVRVAPPKQLKLAVPAGERTRLKEAQIHPMLLRDPCWSLVADPRSGAGEHWAGFQSGRITKFAVKDGRVTEAEGAELLGDGAVWALAATADPTVSRVAAAAGARSSAFLAYGTARGAIGVVHATNEGSETQVAHIYQTRESLPISSIFAYSDFSFGDEHRRFFLATTQEGVAVLLRVHTTPFAPPGSRVDRFSLPGTVRAAVPIRADDDSKGPDFLVASGDGVLRRLCLALPRGSQRRRDAGVDTHLLLSRARHDLGLLFGDDHTVDGLRLLRVGGEQLRRFSLWRTMQEAAADLLDIKPQFSGEPPYPYVPPAVDQLLNPVRRYLEVMAGLAEDCFRLRPFRREPAKILWEEGARVARTMAAAALEHPDRDDLLQAALTLHAEVDDLCNRWMGSAHGDEAAVLAHSFAHLLDWADLALLGRSTPEGSMQGDYRQMTLTKLIARRLTYDSPMVPLEALRVINDSSWRVLVAIAEARVNSQLPESHWTRSFGRRSEAARAGLYELSILVGELGKKAMPTARSGDPLISEVVRNFALSLLLTPNRSGVIYQVFSESGLFGAPYTLRAEVRRLAERYRVWLEGLVPGGATNEMARAIELFDLASETSEGLVERSWDKLEEKTRELGEEPDDVFSDATFYAELNAVIGRARGLQRILPSGSEETNEPATATPVAARSLRYFPHSAVYLASIAATRDLIRAALGDPKTTPPGDQLRTWREKYEELVAKLAKADLFEPQRSQYALILRSWKSEIESRGWAGLDLLVTLDRMNRHVFRRDADRLLEAVIELSCRAAPPFPTLLLENDHGAPAKLSIREHLLRELENRPLLRALYEQTQVIVETNSLTSALLVAGVTRIRGGSLGTVTREQLFEAFSDSCSPHGIKVDPDPAALEECPTIPGNRLLWKAVFSELALNLRNYGTQERGPGRHASITFAVSERGLSLVIAGNNPLVYSLPNWSVLVEMPDDELRELLSKKVASAFKTGRRLGIASESSTGMGIFILQRIATLMGADLSCRVAAGRAAGASWETVMDWTPAALRKEGHP